MKAKRAVTKIGDIQIEVFQLPDDEYVMSQSQVAEAVGRPRNSMLRFRASELSKSNRSKPFECYTIPINKDWKGQGNRQDIKAVPIDIATKFWVDQALKGNMKAVALVGALAEETLRRRCDKLFNEEKSEEEYNQRTATNIGNWRECRDFLVDSHLIFTYCCKNNCYVASVVHNKITVAICGKTASELRELELIEGNPTVGLNHIKDKEILIKIAEVKRKFSSYRTGHVDERIQRAVEAVTGIKTRKRKQMTANN